MFHTSRKTRCANNLPLENKSFRWTKLQKRAAKKTSNCSKKDTNYLKIWKIAWHFFHPRNHHIYAGFSITYHWQKNCIPVADKDPEVPEVIWCVFGGVPPFFVSKALEPKSVGGFNQGFQLARRVRFERIWSTPSRGSWMGIIFFHTLLWCLWRDSKKRTQWWCETRLHFWLSLYSKLVINSNWK